MQNLKLPHYLHFQLALDSLAALPFLDSHWKLVRGLQGGMYYCFFI